MDERLKKRQCCSHFIMTQLRFWRDAFRHSFMRCWSIFLHFRMTIFYMDSADVPSKETPGRELGGWYSNDSSEYSYIGFDEIFNTFGQWLSFLGRAYRATGNQKVREKAVNLLNGWGETIDEDGYFFYTNDCNAHHYSYEKIMSGLVDLYVYAEIEEAADYLAKDHTLGRKTSAAHPQTCQQRALHILWAG